MIRRVLAVLLAIVLVVTLVPTLALLRVNDTFANPAFYAGQLSRADIYNFIYDSALPVALDRMQGGGMANLAWAKTPIVTVARQTFPPEWLQEQTEKALFSVLPYLAGDTGAFSLSIPLKDRVQAAGKSLKSALRQGDVMDRFYAQAIQSLLGQAVSGAQVLPIPVSSTAMVDALKKALPPEWMLAQMDAAIDETIPYLTRDKQSFTIKVSISDRLEPLQTAFIDMLKTPEAYDLLTRQTFVQVIKQNMSRLPAGITLTDEEIVALAKQSFQYDWYQARVPDLVGQIFAYLRGEKPTFEITLPVSDRKPAISAALSRLVEPKIPAWFDNLPVDPNENILTFGVKILSGAMPTTRPSGLSYSLIKTLLNFDISALISPIINAALPDQFRLSDPAMAASLSQLRDLIQKGFVFTERDIAGLVGAGRLETIRNTAAGGVTLTDKDLSSAIGTGGDFDSFRSLVGTARRLSFIPWIVFALMLAAIAWLGGRRTAAKLMWAGGVLAIAGVIALVVFGPVFAVLVQSRVDAVLAQMVAQPDPLSALLFTKATAIVRSSIGSFVGGLRVQSVITLVIGVVAVGLGIFMDRRRIGQN